MYKVSILVPIYGVEKYIERCCRSLFEQSYHNLEFVFVNDCTPDQSIEVLKKVMDDYPNRKDSIRIISHEKNRGLAASRNTGLDNSQGDFVICVDSDDWLELRALEWLVNKQKERNSDITFGQYLVHYDGLNRLLPSMHYDNQEEMVLQMMQRTWNHFLAGKLLRKSLFVDHNLRWKEGLNVAEDRYMMTLLAYNLKVFDSVDNVVYHYDRRNVLAITMSNDKHKIISNNNQELKNVLLLEQYFQDKEEIYRRAISRCVIRQLDYNYQTALKYSAKDTFYDVVNYLDDRNADAYSIIGWRRSGLKGWINHHFFFMNCYRKIVGLIGPIRKKLKGIKI